MSDLWTEKLDLHLDGEMAATEMRELDLHLRSCAACAADVANRLQLKRAVHSAAQSHHPTPEFRERIRKTIAPAPSPFRLPRFSLAFALLLLIAIGLGAFSLRQRQLERNELSAELVDLHVGTLASANPVDVVSSDRHTVKPWFEGKVPFTFNLPELQNSEFTLLGGKLVYLEQAPGAELIYQYRKHRMSIFMFPKQDLPSAAATSALMKRQSFNVESWEQNGLIYYAVGDVSADELRNLSALLKAANL